MSRELGPRVPFIIISRRLHQLEIDWNGSQFVQVVGHRAAISGYYYITECCCQALYSQVLCLKHGFLLTASSSSCHFLLHNTLQKIPKDIWYHHDADSINLGRSASHVVPLPGPNYQQDRTQIAGRTIFRPHFLLPIRALFKTNQLYNVPLFPSP